MRSRNNPLTNFWTERHSVCQTTFSHHLLKWKVYSRKGQMRLINMVCGLQRGVSLNFYIFENDLKDSIKTFQSNMNRKPTLLAEKFIILPMKLSNELLQTQHRKKTWLNHKQIAEYLQVLIWAQTSDHYHSRKLCWPIIMQMFWRCDSRISRMSNSFVNDSTRGVINVQRENRGVTTSLIVNWINWTWPVM